MKSIWAKLTLLILVICVSAAAARTTFAQAANHGAALTDRGWPRKFTSGAYSFSVYQPQIEQWQGNRFEARAAVAAVNL
ncbi:MAG TPA: hypothetical protein VF131_04580 [Blastocatellia bacterium]|nr:hypothetical protein [Blastocatellia bacterium]